MVYFLITCNFAEILKFGVRRFVPEAIDIFLPPQLFIEQDLCSLPGASMIQGSGWLHDSFFHLVDDFPLQSSI